MGDLKKTSMPKGGGKGAKIIIWMKYISEEN